MSLKNTFTGGMSLPKAAKLPKMLAGKVNLKKAGQVLKKISKPIKSPK